MNERLHISFAFMERHTHFPTLVEHLRLAFAKDQVHVPNRHHHNYKSGSEENTLLLMPAWQEGNDLGIKIVTVNPNNGPTNLATIQGTYLLMDANTGIIKAELEAKSLTNKRTAASSALASKYLSNPQSSKMLIMGNGALLPDMIRAHSSVRPISKIWVWGRDNNKVNKKIESFDFDEIEIVAIKDFEEIIKEVDIVTCITSSVKPLLNKKHLNEGQHIDLVGSYKPNMQEADAEIFRYTSTFMDTANACLESGDLLIPLQSGILQKDQIKDLSYLCKTSQLARKDEKEITVFKSVGYALEDLVAARYYVNQFQNQ